MQLLKVPFAHVPSKNRAKKNEAFLLNSVHQNDVIFSISDISSTWYRDITTDPIWEGLADCANESDQRVVAPSRAGN